MRYGKREPLLSGTRNDIALVIDSRHLGESSCDAKDGVESIGLSTGLSRLGVGSCPGLLASILRSLVSAAAVSQSVAHELGDDVDVLSGTVVVRSCDRPR